MPVRNPSFEMPGDSVGLAAQWTLRTFVARERIAGFGPPPHRGREDFDRWHAWVPSLEHARAAVFEPRREAMERFDAGWQNDRFALELPTGVIVRAPLGPRGVEDLEAGWAGPWRASWGDVPARRARFGGEPSEAFERGWRGNEAARWSWAELPSEPGRFDGAETVERFDGGDWPRI